MIEADVTAYRPRLFGLAYRMVGTRADAEDIVQEAYLRWQSAEHAAIRDPQAWLVTTTTHAALDRLRVLKRERERYDGPWIPEPVVHDAAADPEEHAEIADDISVAFLLMLERLAPDERAALILHDVFAYQHAEIAGILGRSEEAVRQMVHRARQRVRADRPRFRVDRRAAAALVERFLHAVESGDEGELRKVLAEDVTHLADGGGAAAASRELVVGREKIVRLLLGIRAKFWSDLHLERADVNDAPGLVVRDKSGAPRGVIALATDGTAITNLNVVVAPDKVARIFGPEHGGSS